MFCIIMPRVSAVQKASAMQKASALKTIIQNHPPIELAYDKFLHRQVLADSYFLCPCGATATLWFSHHKNKETLVLTTYDRKGNPHHRSMVSACFSEALIRNTVIKGIYFTVNKNKCFACEDILFYNGTRVPHNMRLELLTRIIQFDIGQVSYGNNFIIIAMPVVAKNMKEAAALTETLPYPVHHCRAIVKNQASHIICAAPKIGVVLNVSADLDSDIYHLMCRSNDQKSKTLVSYGVAAIQSYKTSVMLNKIFRNIRENANLDLLEESEDEDEFENTSQDKFVDLNKSVNMRCMYNKRFRKWEPIAIAPQHTQPSYMHQVIKASR